MGALALPESGQPQGLPLHLDHLKRNATVGGNLTGNPAWQYSQSMTTTKTKITYSLDDELAQALAKLAAHWKVPESEALRRAVLQVASGYRPVLSREERLAALDQLRDSLAARGVDFDAWAREAYALRHGDDPE